MMTADNTSRPNETPGNSQPGRKIDAMNSAAQNSAMIARIALAGNTAWTSVNDAPLTKPRLENASPNLSR